MENIGIYKITNIKNNKIYVGSSSNLNRRYYHHINDLINNKHFNIHLQRSFNIDGEESFNFEIIEYCKYGVLVEREEYYIKFLNCLNDKIGYNINPNGDRPPSWLGRKHTDETKIKMGNSSRGRIQTEYAKNIASLTHKGKIITDEHKKILSDKNIGDKNPMHGRTPYDIWLEKYGEEIADEKQKKMLYNRGVSNKGRIVSEETRQKLSNSLTGRIFSKETIEKMKISNKGRIVSKETKKKQSEKRKGELNPSCKIKDIEIQKIIDMINNGETIKEISKKYNVCTATIRNIKNGKRKI